MPLLGRRCQPRDAAGWEPSPAAATSWIVPPFSPVPRALLPARARLLLRGVSQQAKVVPQPLIPRGAKPSRRAGGRSVAPRRARCTEPAALWHHRLLEPRPGLKPFAFLALGHFSNNTELAPFIHPPRSTLQTLIKAPGPLGAGKLPYP